MEPKKIVIYTRESQTPFHCALARKLEKAYPEAKIVIASFFWHSIEIAQRSGFATFYLPAAIRNAATAPISDRRIAEIDKYCAEKFLGLNAMLLTERFLPKTASRVQEFLVSHLTVLDDLVDEQTLSISIMYDHFFYLAAGMMAFMKGGAHFAFLGSGVPGERVVGIKTPNVCWQNRHSGEDPAKILEEAKHEITKPPDHRIEYMKPPQRPSSRRVIQHVEMALRRRRCARKDFMSGSYFPTNQRRWPFDQILNRTRALFRRKRNEKWDISSVDDLRDLKSPAVLMALHFEPEAVIFMYSPRLRDQIEACRLVAQTLPLGYNLLVKENPKMAGRRSPGYYQNLKKIPNVLLVAPTVPSLTLIDISSAVVSLAGTVTLEARLRGKPAFCLGKPPFFKLATASGHRILNEISGFLGGDKPFDSEFEAAWAEWIAASFPARGGDYSYDPSVGRRVFDHSEKNVNAYYQFITQTLIDDVGTISVSL